MKKDVKMKMSIVGFIQLVALLISCVHAAEPANEKKFTEEAAADTPAEPKAVTSRAPAHFVNPERLKSPLTVKPYENISYGMHRMQVLIRYSAQWSLKAKCDGLNPEA
ncbi:MAG: hypothetical protein HQK65_09095 [Desulfamplus sp.]|nr:hypothetical protein [Desulfamplus sp.]